MGGLPGSETDEGGQVAWLTRDDMDDSGHPQTARFRLLISRFGVAGALCARKATARARLRAAGQSPSEAWCCEKDADDGPRSREIDSSHAKCAKAATPVTLASFGVVGALRPQAA